jgi:DNA-directed RNA polymerase specialized sigma24 family protein
MRLVRVGDRSRQRVAPGTVSLVRHTESVTEPVEIASRATLLLRAVAAGVPGAAQDYDTLLYPLIYSMVKQRGRLLASRAARLTGTDGIPVPAVPACDVDWIANDVAVQALERARAAAHRFDPARGDGLMWAMRAASFCYVDVVRATYGTRRGLAIVPTEDQHLIEAADSADRAPAPAVIVEQRAALDAALAALTDQERFIVLATVHYGLSYSETAQLLFDDAGQVRRVDRLRQSARQALAKAEQQWRAETAESRAEAGPPWPERENR